MSPPESPVDALLVHDRSLRLLVRGLLSDEHAAEDLAQEAWLATLRSGARPESPGAWLAAVARNLAARLRRGEERRARREQDSARTEGEPAPEEILEREAARARVVAAVLALEEPYRGTVLLRYFENLAPRAIAKRQGVPVETVRTRLKRALEVLRVRLEREVEGGRRAWAALLVPLARGPLGSRLLPPLFSAAAMSTLAKTSGAVAATALLVWLVARRTGSPDLAQEGPSPLARAELRAPREEPALVRTPAPERTEASPSEAGAPALPAPLEGVAYGSLLVRLAWSDGTPASGIHARVEPAWSSGDPSWRALAAVTGSDGTFVLEPLPLGTALVMFDRVEGYTAEIEAGKRATIEARLERGFDVTGLVLDPGGDAVAGAEVWLSYPHSLDEGMVAARTGADGRFLLRACSGGSLGARAPRFAPSLTQALRASEGSTLALELVLMGPGGELTGRVFDSAGALVPCAFVLVEPVGFRRRVVAVPVGGTEEVSGLSAPAQDVRTDETGRFVVAGLEPGLRKLAVRAPGHALWRGEAEVFAHGTTTLDVRLLPGVDVEGCVVDAEGRPVRADVSTELDLGPLEPFWSSTATDSEGRFRLEDLGPGEFVLLAETRSARAKATLRGAPGETIEWNPVLAAGGVIRGQLVDERGVGVPGHYVQSEDEFPWPVDPCGTVHVARTGAEGRFQLIGLGDHPHRLEAHAEGLVHFPLAVATGVIPEREPVLLRIAPENRPSIRIAGTVLDPHGAAVANAQVRVKTPASRRSPQALTDAEGHFELGPYPPGTWSVEVRAPSGAFEAPPTTLGPRELAPDEIWDCGAIVLEPR